MANKKYDKVTMDEAAKMHAAKPNLELVVKKIETVTAETTPTKLLQADAEWQNLSQILMIELKEGEEFNWTGFADDFNARVKNNAEPGKNLKALTAGECRKGARQHCQRRLAEADQALVENAADSAALAKKDEILKIISLRGWTEIARGWTAEDGDTKLKARSNKAAKTKDKATNHRAVVAANGSSGKADNECEIKPSPTASEPAATVPAPIARPPVEPALPLPQPPPPPPPNPGQSPDQIQIETTGTSVPGRTTADEGLAPATPAGVPPIVEPGKTEDKPAPMPKIESDDSLRGSTGNGPAIPAAQASGNPVDPEPIGTPGKREDASLIVPGTIEYLEPQELRTCAPFRDRGQKPEGMVYVVGFAKPFSNFINNNGGGFNGKAWIKPELAEFLQRSMDKYAIEHPK